MPDPCNATSVGEPPQAITLTRAELADLLDQAAARGAARALHDRPVQTYTNAEAAEFVYGRSDRIEAWRQMRRARPEIDAASIGTGAARHWTREALDAFVAKNPHLRRRGAHQPMQ